MSNMYVGEIRMFGGNFAPAGWMFCEGQLLPISEYETLFNLIGTTYGGDGQSTFALPDLRGRLPIHMGSSPGTSNYVLAETGGVEQVTLNLNQTPAHSHAVVASADAAADSVPNNKLLGAPASVNLYKPVAPSPSHVLNPAALTNSGGGSQPHDNFQPYLCVSFIISLFGIFPSQT